MQIHPSAKVHPSCVLEGDIEVGAETVIDALCYIKGPVVIGSQTHIYPHCVIGTDAEHRSLPSVGAIRIGSRTILRELSVVQRGTGDRETTIGDDNFIMDHVHIAHDNVIGSKLSIGPNTVFAGHVRIHDGVTIGVSTCVHQFTTIGAFAMVGMGAVVTRDIPPFALVVGNPAAFVRINTHPMAKLGLSPEALRVAAELESDHPFFKEALEKFATDRRPNRKQLTLALV